MSEWIEVSKELPSKKCLAFYKNSAGNTRTVCAKYTKKHTEEALSVDDYDWLDYDEVSDAYYYPEGWYEMIDNWDDYNFVVIHNNVTHWMPLPESPKD